jgi:Beta protein
MAPAQALQAKPLKLADMPGAIPGLCEAASVHLTDVDLVLDFRAIQQNQVTLLRRLVVNAIRTMPNIASYRTLTLLTGVFPINLASTPVGISQKQRADWVLWLSVRSATLPRLRSFGDYTANHPDQEEVDPRIMQPSASIRYAADSDWIIARGPSVRSPRFGGYGQYQQLSKLLKQQPQFAGNSVSWASDFIDACAGGGQTGNLTTWRKVPTNRHMALAAYQTASLT